MNKLTKLIESKGLTNYEIGQKIKPKLSEHSQRMYIADIIAGRRALNIKDAIKLSKILNCEVKELI